MRTYLVIHLVYKIKKANNICEQSFDREPPPVFHAWETSRISCTSNLAPKSGMGVNGSLMQIR